MSIMKDPFDTDVFAQVAYKITMGEAVNAHAFALELKKLPKGFISCFTPVIYGNLRILEDHQFQLISVRNTYRFIPTGNSYDPLTKDYTLSSPLPDQSITKKQMQSLAEPIYLQSRYHKDKKLKESSSRELYYRWIENSLFHGYAQFALLAWYRKEPIGICTVREAGSSAFIDLLGVSPEHQRKGIASQLLFQTIKYARSKNAKKVLVVTEAENVPANIFYQRNHFLVEKVELVYHKHT